MIYKKISEITTVVTGGTPSTSINKYWDGNIPWLQSGCCQNCDVNTTEKYITEEGYNNSNTKIMPKDTVMIALTGATAGKIGYLNFEACGNQSITGILPCELINQRFLFYYLISKRTKILSDCVGGAQAHISQGYVKNMEIPIYPLNKQIEIVNKINHIKNIINLRKHQLQQLDTLIKARFVEMFGDPVTNPKNWETYSLDECYEIASSKRILKSEWKTEGIPFLRVRDMVDLATTGKTDNEFYVSEDFYSTLKDSDGVPKVGDILVSATSTLGKCHIVNVGECYYFKDADVLRFRAKKDINPIYFVEQMKTIYIERQIARTLGVTTVAHFTIKAAKTINMRLPDITLQNQFADFVKQTDKSKVVVQKALDEAQLLFDSLMQEYFG